MESNLEYYGEGHRTNNHLLNNVRALYFLGVFLEREEWRKMVRAIFRNEIERSVKKSEFLREKSSSYQLLILRWFQEIERAVCCAGDVIEPIINLDGFLKSALRHMKQDGERIISTSNFLSVAHSFFTAVRGFPFVNIEHVHSFDPKTLIRVGMRFCLRLVELVWINTTWRLGCFLPHASKALGYCDFISGCWSPRTGWRRAIRYFTQQVLVYPINVLMSALRWGRYQCTDCLLVFSK